MSGCGVSGRFGRGNGVLIVEEGWCEESGLGAREEV